MRTAVETRFDVADIKDALNLGHSETRQFHRQQSEMLAEVYSIVLSQSRPTTPGVIITSETNEVTVAVDVSDRPDEGTARYRLETYH